MNKDQKILLNLRKNLKINDLKFKRDIYNYLGKDRDGITEIPDFINYWTKLINGVLFIWLPYFERYYEVLKLQENIKDYTFNDFLKDFLNFSSVNTFCVTYQIKDNLLITDLKQFNILNNQDYLKKIIRPDNFKNVNILLNKRYDNNLQILDDCYYNWILFEEEPFLVCPTTIFKSFDKSKKEINFNATYKLHN